MENLPTVDEMTDILDIEGILALSDYKWLATFILLVVLLVIGWIAYRLIKNRLRSKDLPEERLSPEAKALLELERLKAQGLLQKQEYRKYYFFASEILRRFFLERFNYPALEKTTFEIGRDFLEKPFLETSLASQALHLLSEADGVKFARRRLLLPEMESIVDRIRDFVIRAGRSEEMRQAGR